MKRGLHSLQKDTSFIWSDCSFGVIRTRWRNQTSKAQERKSLHVHVHIPPPSASECRIKTQSSGRYKSTLHDVLTLMFRHFTLFLVTTSFLLRSTSLYTLLYDMISCDWFLSFSFWFTVSKFVQVEFAILAGMKVILLSSVGRSYTWCSTGVNSRGTKEHRDTNVTYQTELDLGNK